MSIPIPFVQTRHARRLYVGGLPPNVADEELLKNFLQDVIAKALGHTKPQDYILSIYINKAKGFAFIELNSCELAAACLELDGILYKKVVLKVLRANEYKPDLVTPSMMTQKIVLDLSHFEFDKSDPAAEEQTKSPIESLASSSRTSATSSPALQSGLRKSLSSSTTTTSATSSAGSMSPVRLHMGVGIWSDSNSANSIATASTEPSKPTADVASAAVDATAALLDSFACQQKEQHSSFLESIKLSTLDDVSSESISIVGCAPACDFKEKDRMKIAASFNDNSRLLLVGGEQLSTLNKFSCSHCFRLELHNYCNVHMKNVEYGIDLNNIRFFDVGDVAKGDSMAETRYAGYG